MEIAFVLIGHSQYQDDVWKLVCEAGFCNDFTPIGWLLACGCQAKSWVLEGKPENKAAVYSPDPSAQFGVTVTFDGPLDLLLKRLRFYLQSDVGFNCDAKY